MKRTITRYFFVLFTLLMTATTVRAEAVQSADRDKISGIVVNLISQWDQQAFENAKMLITQVAQFDLTNVATGSLVKLLGMKSAIEGTTDYRLLFSGRVFTGHFVVQDGAWVKESDADDLQFTYEVNGVPVVLKLTTSDETKMTSVPMEGEDIASMVGGLLSGKDSQMAEVATMALESFLDGVTMLSLDVPAQTNLDLTIGGQPLVTLDIKMDLDALGETPLDGIMVSNANLKFYKGLLGNTTPGTYEVNIANTGYKPGAGINIDITGKKDNAQLISLKLNAPGTLDLQNLITEEGINLGFDQVTVYADVMGQGQLKGNINLNALLSLSSAMDMITSEAEMKALLEQANQQIDVKLYYDGSTTPAASLQLLPAYDEEDEEWAAEAYIVFASDNKSYLIGDFFSEENFPEILQAVMGIAGEMGDIAEVIKNRAEETIQSVADAKLQKTVATEFYTIDGRRTTQAAKGLKVVRMSDGTIRKVMAR